MRKIKLAILGFVLIISSILKIESVKANNFAFTMDQGRDLVDIRQMVVNYSPRLVGPTTSINGVLLGPFWYYFLLPPFIASGGNPQVIMHWQIAWYQLSILFLWWVIKKYNKNLAFISAFLLLLSPTGFYTGRYFWNANAMPIMSAFFFGILLLTLEKITNPRLVITGLIAGLSMQVEAAFGILFFPFAFIYLGIKNKNIKQLLYLTSGFVVTLLPQALFELRHQFIMTKVLISEFTGKAAILGQKMTLQDRIPERWDNLIKQVRNISHIPENYTNIIFIVSILIVLIVIFRENKKTINKNLATISLTFFLFAAIFYLAFPQQLKEWYTLGISVPLTLIVACAFNGVWSSKNKFALITIGIILLLHLSNAIMAQTDFIINDSLRPSNNPSYLRNQLTGIDWVYRQANGQAFKEYSYVPSVYDYSLNYLYWWYGTKTYGYQPSDIAYLPNQPEYIQGNNTLWKKTKQTTDSSPTFLMIEKDKDMPSREQKWLGNFSKLCTTKNIYFPWNVEIKMLTNCK